MAIKRSIDLISLRRLFIAGVAASAFASPAFAQTARHSYNIPAQDMADALNAFAHQSGLRLLFPYSAAMGRRSAPLLGAMSEEAALQRLLSGANLVVVSRSGDVLTLGVGQVRPAAAPPPPVVTAVVEELIVTANKRPERLHDIPMSMSAIGGDKLDAMQSQTLQDVVDNTPGVQLIALSPIANSLVIRGLTVGGSVNSLVATYVDEVPYTAQGPFAFGANIAPNFDTYDLARVEVLRGPQGTLYGANALTGLLKYVTNAPNTSQYEGSIRAGVSSVAHSGQAGWDLHGMVNLPLGDKMALRIVANDNRFPGYVDDPGQGLVDTNLVDRYGVRVSLLWRASPEVNIRLSVNLQHLRAGDSGTEDLSLPSLTPIYGDLGHQRVISELQSVTNAIYNGVVNWDLGFGDLVSSTSIAQVKPWTIGDLSPVFTPILTAQFGRPLGAASITNEPVTFASQEVRLTSKRGGAANWIVGAYLNDEAADERQPLLPIDLSTREILYDFSPGLGKYHIRSHYREYAVFGDLTWNATRALELGAGGRYSTNRQSYHQQSAGLFTGTDDFVTRSNQSVFTYSVHAKYRFGPDAMVYARIASGFVPGGPNDVIPGSPLPDSFRSSSTTNYEVGFKGSLLDGRLTYDVDGFDIEWQDIQLIAQINNLFSITNGGSARSRGVEGAVSFSPTTALLLGLNGAYTDARLTEDTPASFGGKAGDRLPLSPRFAVTVSAAYERPLWGKLVGFAGGEWHYNGRRMSNFEFGAPRQKFPAYSMINLRLGAKIDAYTITAYVKNLVDARVVSSAARVTINSVSALSAAIGTPRTIGMMISAKF